MWFTYHIVNIKQKRYLKHIEQLKKFTYHIVNIKQFNIGYYKDFYAEFTYHIVNIKPNQQIEQLTFYYNLHIT